MGKYVSSCLRCFAYTLIAAIILLAILIQCARIFAPSIDSLRPNIERYLSKQLNAEVSIAALDASWYALRPHLLVENLSMEDAQGEVLFAVEKADLTLSLLNSLYNLQWTWKKVEFDGVTLKVIEGADQQWSVAGFETDIDSSNKSRRWRSYNPNDLFTATKDVRLTRAKVEFTFANQRHLDTLIPSVLIENHGSLHRLTASASVDNQQVFSLVIEKNEALLEQGLNAVGFLQFKDFPVEKIAQSLIASNPQGVVSNKQQINNQVASSPEHIIQKTGSTQQSTIDLSLWLDFTQDNAIQALGNVALSGVSTSMFGQQHFLNIPVSTDIRGTFDGAKGWELGLRNVLVDQAHSIEWLKLEQRVGNNIEVMVDQLDVKPWVTWLKQNILVPRGEKTQKIVSVLDTMDLDGVVDNVLLSLDSKQWQNSFFATNIKGLSAQPWNGIPGFQNINGYMESTLTSGFVNLSSQNFHIYPDVIYDAPIVFDQVDSQIAWHINKPENTLIVNSNNIQGQGVFGRANSYFLLDVPLKRGSRPASLDLHVGLQNSQVKYQQLLTPNRLSKDLREWLSTSITAGNIEQAGFIYRGGLSREQSKTIQLFFDVNGARVDYSDEWPVVDAIDGQVIIDNQYVNVVSPSAKIANNRVNNIDVVWPGDGSQRLAVKADGKFSTKSALQLLGEGWLGDKLGDTFSSWSGKGNVGVGLNLSLPIPLQDKEPTTQVDIAFDNNDFILKEQKINLQDVKGKLQFSSKQGIFSDNLSALLFEQPIDVAIKQTFNDSVSSASSATTDKSAINDEYISISGKSQVAASILSRWLLSLNDNFELPKENVIAGIIPYTMKLTIPTSENKDHLAALAFTSDLRGADVELPQPYGKSAEQAMSLQVDTRVTSESTSYQIHLGDYIKVNALSEDKSFKGSLAINKPEPKLSTIADNTFYISADMETLALEPLLVAADKYWPPSKQQDGNDLTLHYDIGIDTFLYKTTRLNQFLMKGSRNDDAWIFATESHLFLGDAVIPHNQRTPAEVNVKYFNIPKESPQESNEEDALEQKIAHNVEKEDPLQSIDLSVVRPANVAIDQLRYGDSVLGNLRFTINPIEGGVAVEKIYASFSNMLLKGENDGGVGENDAGASLVWLQGESKEQSRTSFKGALTGGNVEQLFKDLAMPPLIESKTSDAYLDVAWQGSPAVFAVEKLQGELDIRLKKGRFLQGEEGSGTGVLPLLGLFNFDTLLRRIRLDFTDLYKKGVVFDRVTSRLEFDNEWIYFKEPLVVTSPSSTFNVAGKINYPNKQVDAVLVATLPVSGNLAFVAALAAGLPAAAGVYIVSKIFSPQVNKASSLNYTITGDWDKPKVSFMRLSDKKAKADADSSQVVEMIPFENENENEGEHLD